MKMTIGRGIKNKSVKEVDKLDRKETVSKK
jgi:hypothetical protein